VGGKLQLGFIIWLLGFVGNIWHDDELREIRRKALRDQKRKAAEKAKSAGKNDIKKGESGGEQGVSKVYVIPQNGLFAFIFYPHYLCEWIEWGGYWLMAGSGCVPARNFLMNEIACTLPRAFEGKKWYIEKFGKEKVNGKKAIIPGIW
jgi:3-oxo-5-alpha-steroid 4-dehydrogenase 1